MTDKEPIAIAWVRDPISAATARSAWLRLADRTKGANDHGEDNEEAEHGE